MSDVKDDNSDCIFLSIYCLSDIENYENQYHPISATVSVSSWVESNEVLNTVLTERLEYEKDPINCFNFDDYVEGVGSTKAALTFD